MFIDQLVTSIAFHKGRFKATSYLPLYRIFPTELSLSVSMPFALFSVNFIHVGDECNRMNRSEEGTNRTFNEN